MQDKRNNNNDLSDASNRPDQATEPSGERRRRGRVITAKDAGWITPTAFVAPITLAPIDPPHVK